MIHSLFTETIVNNNWFKTHCKIKFTWKLHVGLKPSLKKNSKEVHKNHGNDSSWGNYTTDNRVVREQRLFYRS